MGNFLYGLGQVPLIQVFWAGCSKRCVNGSSAEVGGNLAPKRPHEHEDLRFWVSKYMNNDYGSVGACSIHHVGPTLGN